MHNANHLYIAGYQYEYKPGPEATVRPLEEVAAS